MPAQAMVPWLAAVLGLVALALAYWWLASAGGVRTTAEPPYYDALAHAFLAGRLDLGPAPPELLALADPYDPVQNAAYRRPIHDLSLHGGRLYMYWGPLPALLRLPGLAVTGAPPSAITLHVGVALLAVVAFALTLRRAAGSRAVPGDTAFGVVCTVIFALGGLLLYLVGRPSVYHEPLLVAIACALWAWYALLRALAGEPSAAWWYALAGALLALAIAARVTFAMYAAMPGLLLARVLWRARTGDWRVPARQLAAFVLPLAVGVGLLATYNWARFGSPAEFGFRYVMQEDAAWHQLGWQGITWPDPTTVANALSLYLGAWPTLSWFFPHLAWAHAPLSPPGSRLAAPEIGLHTAGMLPALGRYVDLPLACLWLVAPTALGLVLVPLLARHRRTPVAVRTLAISLGVGAVLGLLLVGSFRAVQMRYFADFLPAAALGGALGLQWLFGRWRGTATRRGRAVLALVSGAALPAVGLGLLLGVGTWQYSAPTRALDARYAVEETLGRLGALWPGAGDAWLVSSGRTYWRHANGETWAEGTLYLRAPVPAPALVAELAWPADTAVMAGVRLSGRPVMQQPLQPGWQWIALGPLSEVSAGALVPVQFTLLDPPVPAGYLMPSRVARVGLVANRANDASLLGGISGGEWVTGAGLQVSPQPEDLATATRLVLLGQSEFELLPGPPRVSVVARGADGVARPLGATYRVEGRAYQVEVELAEARAAPSPVGLELTFSPTFSPAERGQVDDTRQLAVRAPHYVFFVPEDPS